MRRCCAASTSAHHACTATMPAPTRSTRTPARRVVLALAAESASFKRRQSGSRARLFATYLLTYRAPGRREKATYLLFGTTGIELRSSKNWHTSGSGEKKNSLTSGKRNTSPWRRSPRPSRRWAVTISWPCTRVWCRPRRARAPSRCALERSRSLQPLHSRGATRWLPSHLPPRRPGSRPAAPQLRRRSAERLTERQLARVSRRPSLREVPRLP